MTPAQVASWVMESGNASGRPGKGERLWLGVAPTANGLRVWGWSSGAEAPGNGDSRSWCPVSWRAEWDAAQGGGGVRGIVYELGAAVGSALARHERALRKRAASEAEVES